MNKYWNYPKHKSSANGKLQPCVRGATQQDVEMLATKQGRQHGDVGQRRDGCIRFLPCAGPVLVRLISSLPAHQLLSGKDIIHCSQDQFKDYSGKLDRHKFMEGSWLMLLSDHCTFERL